MTLPCTIAIRQGHTVHYQSDGFQQWNKLNSTYRVIQNKNCCYHLSLSPTSKGVKSLRAFGRRAVFGIWSMTNVTQTDSAVATTRSTSLGTEAALAEKRVHSSNPALPALSVESGREISDIVVYVELSFSFILGGSVL